MFPYYLFSNFNFSISGFLTILLLIIQNDYYYYRQLLNKIFSNIFGIFRKSSFELEFSCTETHRCFFSGSYTSMNCSDTFKSLCLHIKRKINDGKSNQLFKLKELTNKLYDDNSDNELRDILYIATQNDRFTLLGNEDKDIFFQIQKTNLESNQNESIKGNNYTLTISSFKKNIQYLQKYVDTIRDNYYKNIEFQMLQKEYVFIYEGANTEGELNFSSYPFTTTSSFDNFYHPGKDKIINQINFFRDNKDWYQKRGKPYTLGICSWGIPGCGKTTFEKIVTKYLKRHLIIVDFSKIKTQKEADLIFFNEKINNIIIPYEKRVYCFPDVDRMTDILQNKDCYKKESQTNSNTNNNNEEILSSLFLDKIENKNTDTKKNICSSSPLNLSKILNILDGIPERTGQVIMMSCNHPERLDKAFLRPGRIDILTEFKKMTTIDIKKLVINYYQDKNVEIKHLIEISNIDYKWTPAEVFKICSQNNHISSCCKELVNLDPDTYVFPF